MNIYPVCKDILSKLISFDTTSSKSNLELIDYASNLLNDAGADIIYTYNGPETKANLYASIGPKEASGLILSGHTDVVPVEGQKWDVEPFKLTEKGNKYFGRGTCDMKGYIACILGILPFLNENKNHLVRPVHFSLTFDEEVGCLGVPLLLENLPEDRVRPSYVWVGEPTDLDLVMAHKGIIHGDTQIATQFAHSSRPDLALSSNHIAAKMVVDYYKYLKQLSVPALCDQNFFPPHTTGNIGTICGGHGANIISGNCKFEWELRPLPNVNMDELAEHVMKLFDQVAKELGPCEYTVDEHARVKAFSFAGDPSLHNIYDLLGSSLNSKSYKTVSYTTEAGVFQQQKITPFVLGPGSIEQAHRPNEFVEIQQIVDCEKKLKQTLQNFCLEH